MKKRAFLLLFPAVILLHVLLIASLRLYPFVDMPWYLAAATINKYFTEGPFPEYYSIARSIRPNVLHLLFTSSEFFPTVEFGNTVFLCIYVVLFPVSILLIIRHYHGNPWFALLSFLFIYNYNVRWGFANFIMAVPLALLLFYLISRLIRDRSWWVRLMILGLFVVLFFTDIFVTVFGLILFTAVIFNEYYRYPGRLLKEFIILLPVLAVARFWWKNSQSKKRLITPLLEYYSDDYLSTIPERASLLFADNSALFDGAAGLALGLFFVMTLTALAIAWLIPRAKLLKPFALIHHTFNQAKESVWILLGLSILAFLFAPYALPGQQYLYKRFSVFVFVAIIILLSIFFSGQRPRWLQYSVSLICLFHLVLYAEYFISFQRENAYFNQEVLPDNPSTATLAGLIYDYEYRGKPVYIHFPSYYIVWQKGIATTVLMEFHFGMVRRRAGEEKLPPYDEWFGLHPEYDGRYSSLDYILTRGELPNTVKKALQEDDFEQVNQNDVWALYRKRRGVTRLE